MKLDFFFLFFFSYEMSAFARNQVLCLTVLFHWVMSFILIYFNCICLVLDEITASFRRFGPLVVDWPHKAESKSYFPPKGKKVGRFWPEHKSYSGTLSHLFPKGMICNLCEQIILQFQCRFRCGSFTYQV